jgi:hypothetical protein
MGFFTYFLRDVEQIVFPKREQHAIPSMDGALSPNDRLDTCLPVGEPIPGADDVAEGPDGALYVSSGSQVLRLSGEGYLDRSTFASFEAMPAGLRFIRTAGCWFAFRVAASPPSIVRASKHGSIRPAIRRSTARPASRRRRTEVSS